jgi:predicted HTH transcriptional regulator
MNIQRDELLRLLRDTENSFIERKTSGDSKDDWIKTVVAFANSLDPSQQGVLFVGVTDKGEIESNATNYDTLQNKFSERKRLIYPPVFCVSFCVREGDRECLAVIVPGSPMKPHFAGPLYLRDFAKTVVASTEQYESLLAARTRKTYELQKWQDRDITLVEIHRYAGIAYRVERISQQAKLLACNQFYVSLVVGARKVAYALPAFEIAYDYENDRLQIEREVPETRY